MKKQFIPKILLCSLALGVFPVEAVEPLLAGIRRAVPLRMIRADILASNPKAYVESLEEAAILAYKIKTNCVTTLPSHHADIRDLADGLSNSVFLLRARVAKVDPEDLPGYMKSIPGSDVDRDIRESLHALRVKAENKPDVRELDAYQNAEKVSDALGLA